MIQDHVFREYDIRGIVGQDFDIASAYDLGHALAVYFTTQNPAVKTVAVGQDGRIHSQDIKQQLCAGLQDSGLDVIFIGTCTTPMLYFATHTLDVQAGLMVTASHNPKEYNGVKICLGTQSVYGAQVRVIRDLFGQKKRRTPIKTGQYTQQPIKQQYIDWFIQQFAHLKNSSIAAIVDCGNGAAGTVLPDLIAAMNWANVQLLYWQVDGTYPHHEADPTVEKNMGDLRAALADSDATIGMGLDGDCDRMAAMTKQGQLILGDKLLALFAQPIIAQHAGARFVVDVTTSSALLELLEQAGAHTTLSPAGHANIKQAMKASGALLGGEVSCHFTFGDRHLGFDDGIYALFRLVELLEQSGKTIEQLLMSYPVKVSTPNYRLACSLDIRPTIVQAVKNYYQQRADVQLILVDGVRVQFSHGWAIIRLSNTEALLSLRFEAQTVSQVVELKKEFIAIMRDYIPYDFLVQQLEIA